MDQQPSTQFTGEGCGYSIVRKDVVDFMRLCPDGLLLLCGDPVVWIQRNPADHLSVRFLELFVDEEEKIGGDSIRALSQLTHLFISDFNGDLKYLPESITSLHNLQRLELIDCFGLQELPANLGDLKSLTSLSLEHCSSVKSLPNSIANLYNLVTLHLFCCDKLQEFPSNLGDLESLKLFSLDECPSIKSLPKSISKLSKLTTLHLTSCQWLKELPAISKVKKLILHDCNNIQSLPEGLCNLKQLHLIKCTSLSELPTDLNILELKIENHCSSHLLTKGLTNLEQLHLPLCSKERLPNLMYIPSLCHLTFHSCCECKARLEELPANLGELSGLLTLNIKHTTIKWLPWSITKLPKLRFLFLPVNFRVETIPWHLNDFIVISVEDTHICKTWKELKTEIQLFSIPIVGEMVVEATHSPSTPGYLQYRDNPGPWIESNRLHSLVRILDLELRAHVFERNMINSIRKLPELTHLYISDGNLRNLPLTLTRLTHLSLYECDIGSCCDCLGKLSTLESLTLLRCRNLPEHMDLPVSLTHFALASYKSGSLPDSYMARMRKLANLTTLDLSLIKDLELSFLDLNLTKLKITDCTIQSLPRCLQHLEIIHSEYCRYGGDDRCCDDLQECLNQAVNMRTLSVTCCNIKVLPNIPRHQTLQELQFKDCFNLEELPPNLDELVELHTLNLSGTRIKSLPDSITKLQNLRHLILPKFFIGKSLPKNFEHKGRVSIDDKDDMYYQHAGYNDSCYDFSEGNEIASWSIVSHESRSDIFIELESPHRPLDPLSDATQVHEGSYFSGAVPIDNGLPSSQNHNPQSDNVKDNKTQKKEIPLECILPLRSQNMRLVDAAQQLGVSRSTLQRLLKTYGLIWPSCRKRKQPQDAKSKKRNTKSPRVAKDSSSLNLVDAAILAGHNISVEQFLEILNKLALIDRTCHVPSDVNAAKELDRDALRTIAQVLSVEHRSVEHRSSVGEHRSVEYRSVEHRSSVGDHRYVKERSNSAEEGASLDSVQQPKSSSPFIVKANYNGNNIKFDFSLSSSIEELKEEVRKRLDVDIGKIKMTYQDEDDESILIKVISDLEHALRFSNSSGSNVVKLSITTES